MLTGKNIVSLNEGSQLKEYDRVYLTHGPNDKLEDFVKTSKGKPIQFPAGTEWKGKKPATEVIEGKKLTIPSVHSVQELMQEALNHIVTQWPFDEKLPENATAEQIAAFEKNKGEYNFRLALSLMDAGADKRIYGEIQNELNSLKPIGEAEAKVAQEKLWLKQGKSPAWIANMFSVLKAADDAAKTEGASA